MNRRSFLLGLLSTTAVPAVAKAMPTLVHEPSLAIMRTGLPNITWRRINQAATIIYGTDEAPTVFTGFNTIYNGVPIREIDSIVELLTKENEILKTTFGAPYICDDEMLEEDDD